MRKKYTHLFFDLDNTLWDFERNSYEALLIVFKFYKFDKQGINFNHFYQEYAACNRLCWEDYRQGIINKNELVIRRFKKTLEVFKISETDPLEMNNLYLSEMPNQKLLIEGALNLLDYLKSKGYQLYIITNGFTEVQHKKLEVSGIKKYFLKVFTSEQVNAPKPSSIIFEYAVKSANAKKSHSLMIGDDLDIDIAGAAGIGMDAAFIGRDYGQAQNLLLIKNLPQIFYFPDLSGLSSIL